MKHNYAGTYSMQSTSAKLNCMATGDNLFGQMLFEIMTPTCLGVLHIDGRRVGTHVIIARCASGLEQRIPRFFAVVHECGHYGLLDRGTLLPIHLQVAPSSAGNAWQLDQHRLRHCLPMILQAYILGVKPAELSAFVSTCCRVLDVP